MMRTAFSLTLLSFFCFVSQAQSGYSIYAENGLRGVKNSNQETIVPAKYDSLGWSKGFQIPVDGDIIGYYKDQWGLLSFNNKAITSPKYYDLWAVHKDLIIASVKGKFSNRIFFGAINSKGQAIIEFKYSSIDKIGNNLIIKEERDGQQYFGLLDQKNKVLLNVKYSGIRSFMKELFVFSNEKGKSGIINSFGKVLIKPSLDSISEPENDVAIVYDRGEKGLISTDGNVILPPGFKSIMFDEKGQLITIAFDQWGVKNSSNKPQTVMNCDSMTFLNEDILIVYRNNHLEIFNSNMRSIYSNTGTRFIANIDDKLVLNQSNRFGAIDSEGSTFIKFENDSIHTSENYFYLKKEKKWSIWNKYGRRISKYNYDDIKSESENLIGVKRKGYWGFLDFQGDEVIPIKFDRVDPFQDRVARVDYLNSEGTVNQFGEWVCEPIYDKVGITSQGLSMGKINRRVDLVGQAGNIAFQTYNHLEPHALGFLERTDEGSYGLINQAGRIFLYPEYDSISKLLAGDRIFVKKGNHAGIMTSQGSWDFFLSERYESFLGVSEGYYAVKINGKYGFVDSQQRLRIANRYDSVSLFHEGMAAIKLRDKWGFINKAEKLVIQPNYEEVFDFENGLSIIKENGKFGLIDKSNFLKLPAEYDEIYRYEKFFLLKRNNKYGLMSQDGEMVISTEYDYLERITQDAFIVKRRSKYGVLNSSGLFSIPLIYDEIVFAGNNRYFCITNGATNKNIIKR